MAKKAQSDPYASPRVVETFNDPGYEMGNLASHWNKPSVYNGVVRVVRYRVTAERVDEALDVIRARIHKLWRETNNTHDRDPLIAAAKMYGMVLDRKEFGADASRR